MKKIIIIGIIILSSLTYAMNLDVEALLYKNTEFKLASDLINLSSSDSINFSLGAGYLSSSSTGFATLNMLTDYNTFINGQIALRIGSTFTSSLYLATDISLSQGNFAPIISYNFNGDVIGLGLRLNF
ncbi:hypothetical protein EV215_1771 [Hypnocyclicus thermotrophus]|uniref:Uncharacterized protein n=1 Tax=Hypnocyclicus thermotrophus TaxID=1627895 RepID=A0AA46DXE3_9FUSO|nr:hypothetical protein [Hypnocyclicus thermotrophus]TDT68050.1 hypothetical protein EV215_1771 [Hypnocyclicus thermotrophus]